MQQELTKKQKRILQFIAQKIWRERRSPTIREIARNFRFSSTGTVRDYLRILKKKGFIKWVPKKSRAIEIIGEGLLQLPILGQIYAGSPILTYENIEGYLNLESLIFSPQESIFALRVNGDSMIEAGILPEDLVLVRKQTICHNGDIIVVALDNELTIKCFKQLKGKIYLEPANKNYRPILVKDDFSIIGKVISVIRKYV